MDAGDAETLVAANAHSDAGDATTLAAANAHTDTSSAATLTSAKGYTDTRVNALSDDFNAFKSNVNTEFQMQDRRISRVGAMGAAMVQAGINSVGSKSAHGRLSIGAGFQGGQNAWAIGYGLPIGEHASFSIGGAFSSGENSAGIGFGVDL